MKTRTLKIVRLTPESTERMATLAASFPSLAGVPGVAPFDMVKLVEEVDRENAAATAAYGTVPDDVYLARSMAASNAERVAGFLAWLFDRGTIDSDVFDHAVDDRETPPDVEFKARWFRFESIACAPVGDRIVLARWFLDPWWPKSVAPLALVA